MAVSSVHEAASPLFLIIEPSPWEFSHPHWAAYFFTTKNTIKSLKEDWRVLACLNTTWRFHTSLLFNPTIKNLILSVRLHFFHYGSMPKLTRDFFLARDGGELIVLKPNLFLPLYQNIFNTNHKYLGNNWMRLQCVSILLTSKFPWSRTSEIQNSRKCLI